LIRVALNSAAPAKEPDCNDERYGIGRE